MPNIPTSAAEIVYDPTTSGLSADDVQEAIDALSEETPDYVISSSGDSIVIDSDGTDPVIASEEPAP